MSAGIKVGKNNNGSSSQQPNGSMPKVVGPNVQGHREEYQLVRRLQSALFGGVYEAKGLSSGRDFAIKVLHKSELSKAQESTSIEFCEVPLSEIRFADLMRGYEHVMEAEEHFEDAYCFYVVFELCRGGDLLEALKQKPHGFDEPHVQYLIQQAARGLAYLHKRRVAMQDVSLENMLLHVQESTGHYQVKVCDPGQAVVFELDQNGEEIPVNFRGLVGKSFRPPELHEQRPYSATKVDSWCLGWSTFYLLTAQPLFMSADPVQQDADWLLFQNGEFATLFQQKSNLCSPTGLDFIFRLLQIEPRRRMSITDALGHKWLKDPKILPVLASKELLPEALLDHDEDTWRQQGEATDGAYETAEQLQGNEETSVGIDGAKSPVSSFSPPPLSPKSGVTGSEPPPRAGQLNNPASAASLPAVGQYQAGSAQPSLVQQVSAGPRRVRNLPQSPRIGNAPQNLQLPERYADLRERGRPFLQGTPGRFAKLVATVHSPVPNPASPVIAGVAGPTRVLRAASPMQSSSDLASRLTYSPPPQVRSSSPSLLRLDTEGQSRSPLLRNTSTVPTGGLPPKAEEQSAAPGGGSRGRAWAFRSESQAGDYGGAHKRTGSGDTAASLASETYAASLGRAKTAQAAQALVPRQARQGASSPHVSWHQQQLHPPEVAQGRLPLSPARSSLTRPGAAQLQQRSPSPLGHTHSPQPRAAPVSQAPALGGAVSPPHVARSPSPRGYTARVTTEGVAFNWSGPPLSPRAGSPIAERRQVTTVSRTASPSGGASHMGSPQMLSWQPGTLANGGAVGGFAWAPDPPSPRIRTSPRQLSPLHAHHTVKALVGGVGASVLPRWAPPL